MFQTGTLVIKQEDLRLVEGVVYAPDEIDAQGEYAAADEIQKAAHRYLARARRVKEMHRLDVSSRGAVEIVESFIAPVEFRLANGELVKPGAWTAASSNVLATAAITSKLHYAQRHERGKYPFATPAVRDALKSGLVARLMQEQLTRAAAKLKSVKGNPGAVA